MRHFKMMLMAFAAMMMCTITCCADDKPIPADQLPSAAKTFVKKHFQGQTITYAEKDADSFEARLNNGVKVEFDKKGNWDAVESKTQPVPSELVPPIILNYVRSTYTDAFVTKIDKERNGYELELSNGLELKFNKKGFLTEIDD